jgi:hypothetical protein
MDIVSVTVDNRLQIWTARNVQRGGDGRDDVAEFARTREGPNTGEFGDKRQ